jgi:hypothetical protein
MADDACDVLELGLNRYAHTSIRVLARLHDPDVLQVLCPPGFLHLGLRLIQHLLNLALRFQLLLMLHEILLLLYLHLPQELFINDDGGLLRLDLGKHTVLLACLFGTIVTIAIHLQGLWYTLQDLLNLSYVLVQCFHLGL